MIKIKILNVDALHDGCSWSWNSWYTIMETDIDAETLDNNRKLFKFLRDENILSEFSKGRVSTLDDGYNVEILDRNTQRPILALCYGEYLRKTIL